MRLQQRQHDAAKKSLPQQLELSDMPYISRTLRRRGTCVVFANAANGKYQDKIERDEK
jgi:hypothetical protein